jgi:hypothetical protein
MVPRSLTTSFRLPSGVLLAIGTWTLCAGLLVGGATTSGVAHTMLATPYAAAVSVLGWLVFMHPRVDVREDGVVVVNPLRTIRAPWSALTGVTTGYTLTLVTANARYAAWAAPDQSRGSAFMAGADQMRRQPSLQFDPRIGVEVADLPSAGSGVGGADLPSAGSGEAAALVRERWEKSVGSRRPAACGDPVIPVDVRWHARAIAIVVGLLALGAVLQLAAG